MITFLDIVQKVCATANEPIPTTIQELTVLRPQQREAMKWLNFGAEILGKTYLWRFLQRDFIIEPAPVHLLGTAVVTQGSRTVTGSAAPVDTAWTTAMEGRLFRTKNFQEPYRIKTVSGVNALELELVYNGESIVSPGGGYDIWQNQYKLPPDFDDELSIFNFLPPSKMKYITYEDMQERRVNPLATPTLLGAMEATISGYKEDRLILEFGGIFDDPIQIPTQYFGIIPELTKDEATWGFPRYARSALHDWAVSRMRIEGQDDLQRGQISAQQFFLERSEFSHLTKTQPRPRIAPETGERRIRMQRRRGFLRRRSNDAFDRDLNW